MDIRKLLLSFYQHALGICNGESCVRKYISDTSLNKTYYTIAIGKAACDMMHGAAAVTRKGLVITRHGYAQDSFSNNDNIQVIESGHPVPDENSLIAGNSLLEFITLIPQDAECLFLLSGGASALVEVLPDGVDINKLERLNNWLIGSGLDIRQVNIIRKQVSCIKGGRLAKYFDNRKVTQLIISDVIGDQLDAIGSGLLVANEQSLAPLDIPDWIQDLMTKAPPLPRMDDTSFRSVSTVVLANNQTAINSLKEKALSVGIDAFINTEPLVDDIKIVSERLGQYIKTAQPGLHVFGGEPVVNLPKKHGRGGRMQTLAVLLAQLIKNRDDVSVLCGATDGSDGNSEDAGAIVDGHTIERAEIEGFDPEQSVLKADCGSLLEASGDLIQTGPTGTNVNDLVIVIKK